jgi:hypothetical protein
LFFNLLLRRRGKGDAGSLQNKSARFAGVGARGWLSQLMSLARIIAQAGGPSLTAIGVFGLGNGRLKAVVRSAAAAFRLTKAPDVDNVNV